MNLVLRLKIIHQHNGLLNHNYLFTEHHRRILTQFSDPISRMSCTLRFISRWLMLVATPLPSHFHLLQQLFTSPSCCLFSPLTQRKYHQAKNMRKLNLVCSRKIVIFDNPHNFHSPSELIRKLKYLPEFRAKNAQHDFYDSSALSSSLSFIVKCFIREEHNGSFHSSWAHPPLAKCYVRVIETINQIESVSPDNPESVHYYLSNHHKFLLESMKLQSKKRGDSVYSEALKFIILLNRTTFL